MTVTRTLTTPLDVVAIWSSPPRGLIALDRRNWFVTSVCMSEVLGGPSPATAPTRAGPGALTGAVRDKAPLAACSGGLVASGPAGLSLGLALSRRGCPFP